MNKTNKELYDIFEANKVNMFQKLWDETTNDEGEDYVYNYKFKLDELCDDFIRLVNVFYKHHAVIGIETMVAWILGAFASSLGDVDEQGCYLLAYELTKAINE